MRAMWHVSQAWAAYCRKIGCEGKAPGCGEAAEKETGQPEKWGTLNAGRGNPAGGGTAPTHQTPCALDPERALVLGTELKTMGIDNMACIAQITNYIQAHTLTEAWSEAQ